MRFALALWIFLLVNTATGVAPPKACKNRIITKQELKSLRNGQIISIPKKQFGKHDLVFYPAIFLDSIDGLTLRVAHFWANVPHRLPERKVNFDDIFKRENYTNVNGECMIPMGDINLEFSYILSETIRLPSTRVILDRGGMKILQHKMNVLRVQQIHSLDKGQVINVLSSVMYGRRMDHLFTFAIVLDRIQSQGGLILRIVQFTTNLPHTVPPECRGNFKDYFRSTSMRSDGGGPPLRGQIDLRSHDVGLECISFIDRKVVLIPEEVIMLEAAMATLSLLPPVGYRPTKEQINSFKKGQLIWVLSNMLHQDRLFPPYSWVPAIFLGRGQSQDGFVSERLRIVPFAQKLPYLPPHGCVGVFQAVFPGTLFVAGPGQVIKFNGQIDLSVHEMELRFIFVPPDVEIFASDQVESMEGLIKSLGTVCFPTKSLRSPESYVKPPRGPRSGNNHAAGFRGKQRRALGNVTTSMRDTTVQPRGRA